MGSSAMGASVLRRKIQDAGFADVTVVNKAIANLDDTFDLVVTHQDLTDRARQRTGSAIHVSVDNFMGSPRYDEIVELLQRTNARAPVSVGGGGGVGDSSGSGDAGLAVLGDDSIVLVGTATTRDEAITESGRLLVEAGAVTPAYVDAMHEREKSVSTHMGNGLAIPHGTNEAKSAIRRTAISFVRYPADRLERQARGVRHRHRRGGRRAPRPAGQGGPGLREARAGRQAAGRADARGDPGRARLGRVSPRHATKGPGELPGPSA